MLIQIILDWFSKMVADFLDLLPPLPPELSSILGTITSGMDWVEDQVWTLGIIVPFETITALLVVWQVAIGVWLVAIAVAMILRIARTGS